MKSKSQIGKTTRLLYEEPFNRMFAGFMEWRIDPFIRQLETTKEEGRILPFVRGLRLSAQLIYIIRDILSGSNLTASWGHIMDEPGNYCSKECDVIIHQKGYITRWNGAEHPVMDFRFIDQKKVKAVISCKSYIKRSIIDAHYCKMLKKYTKHILLFAECCAHRSITSINKHALETGYKRFWHLYTWSKKKAPEPNNLGWVNFVDHITKISTKKQ